MPNVFKVLPLAILLALGHAAGASTTPPTGQTAAAKAKAGPKAASPAKVSPAPTKTTAKAGSAKSAKASSPPPAAKEAGPRAATPTKTAAARPRVPLKVRTRTAAGAKRPSATQVASASPTPRVARASIRPAVPQPVYRPAYRSLPDARGDGALDVESGAALVVDPEGQVIYSKNPDEVLPIASITKLMTALVVLDSRLPLDEAITITADDKDYLRNTHSRLQVGSQLTRRELLHIALMSSENRAAAALGRTHPAGKAAFIQLMNAKARLLGMRSTRFADSTGLDGDNVSTARDLVKLVEAASAHPLIREFTTTAESEVEPGTRRTPMLYRNSNRLVRGGNWDIQLSKTGYLNEAGRCLVMQAEVAGRPLVFVFLSGPGRQTPMGDANRIRAWLENGSRTG